MPAAAAAALPAVIGAGTSVANGIIQGDAADAANKAAQQASAANLAQAKQVYSDTSNNLNPFIQGGQTANTALLGLLGIGGNPEAANNAFNQFRNSTNYNFLLNQGLQGVQSANAQSFNSGATAKALNNYAQGMAGNALSGYMNTLGGLGSQGVQSASNLGTIGQNYVQQSGGFRNNAATAAGSNAISQANALTNAIGGFTKAVTPGLSSFIGGLGGGGGNGALPSSQMIDPSSYTVQQGGLNSDGWMTNAFGNGG